ncbi:hypothetical protein CYPRO_2479 [Cyclonatronum proteinivorum]|uniref:Glycosyl transferase family 2 n=1 Tax=Cyclonatronum proteinivorum TaxID=1457365 RepID=A0A345UML9_9BACT|nr:hypothetical protein [Cyclonatronum proteinivorum]AXJ01721.1 hypothetical protein CYPRO_2479 [Cyclonatronum proteinivorum]
MTRAQLYIAVMSYEMGILLRNCLTSIEKHAPGIALAIYDDGSRGPETKEVLDEYASKIPVYVNNWRDGQSADPLGGHIKVGGLWTNMQRAFRHARAAGFSYIMFVQDDMQVVGPLDDTFFAEHRAIWADRPDIVQIRISYYRNPLVDPTHDPVRNRICASGRYYMAEPVPQGLNATGIVSIDRLHRAGYAWEKGEHLNNRKSAAQGMYSVFPKTPLIPQLPYPPVVKDRLPRFKRWLNHISDMIFLVGFHPYADLSPAQISALRNRDPEERPVGEVFLTPRKPVKLYRPWCYENSYAHLMVAFKRAFSSAKP